MLKYAILAHLTAKPGKEADAESFLRSALPFVQEEPLTVHWFGFRTGPAAFAIFDTFETEAGRDTHMAGVAAQRLGAVATELFTEVVFHPSDLLAVKHPETLDSRQA